MNKRQILAFLAATALALTACGSVDESADQLAADSSVVSDESSDETQADSSEAESTADSSEAEESTVDESSGTADSLEEADNSEAADSAESAADESAAEVETSDNPHMSAEKTNENALEVDEGGCKNPDLPPCVHYVNDDADIQTVANIVKAAVDGGETIDPETFEFYKGGVHPNFTMTIDGAEYSVYLKPGTASNIKINDQYYNLSGDDFATISEILYW